LGRISEGQREEMEGLVRSNSANVDRTE